LLNYARGFVDKKINGNNIICSNWKLKTKDTAVVKLHKTAKKRKKGWIIEPAVFT